MARSRNKHKHQQYPPHHATATKPSRSVAVILAVIAAIMGLGLAWMMAADNLIWLPVSAIFGAVIGYIVGHTIDKSLSGKSK